MAEEAGWHADPAGRFEYRWWDGEEWTSRVSRQGVVLEDEVPVGHITAGHQLFCGLCHWPQRTTDRRSGCGRCSMSLTNGYVGARPTARVNIQQVYSAAARSFQESIAAAEDAFGKRDYARSLAHLDWATAFARAVFNLTPALPSRGATGVGLAASLLTGGFGLEDLILGPLAAALFAGGQRRQREEDMTALAQEIVRLQIQGIDLLTRCASDHTPDAFERELLRRLAGLYFPDARETVPESVVALRSWCASRVPWAELNVPGLNAFLADYCDAFDWPDVQAALAAAGYRFATREREPGSDAGHRGHGDRAAAAALLGVEPTAAPADIKRAYHREAAKYHPDVLGEVPDHIRDLAEEKMKSINAAYDLLCAAA